MLIEKTKLESNYDICERMNPIYLEADFNGDNKLDIAIWIEEKSTHKQGILILHGTTGNQFILGAGRSYDGRRDNLSSIDVWKLYREHEASELTVDEKKDISGSRIVKINFTGIEVIKSEASSGIIFWDGKAYKWIQTSD